MPSSFTLSEMMLPIGGIVRNVSASKVDPAHALTLHNWTIRYGQLEKVKGWRKIEPTQAVQGNVNLIQNVRYKSGRADTLVLTDKNAYRMDGTTLAPISAGAPFEMASNERWSAEFLNKKWYFTNPVDGLYSWDGQAPFVKVPTGTAVGGGAHIVSFLTHLLLGNVETGNVAGAYTVAGSNLNAADWDYGNANSDAILIPFEESATKIQKLMRGNGVIEVYKEDMIQLLQYVGAGLAYARQIAVPKMGMLAAYSCLDLGDRRAYIGQDDFYQFNGSTNQRFGAVIWKWWNDQVNAAAKNATYGFQDQRWQEAIWGAQYGDNYDTALVYNYDIGSFLTRDWPFQSVGYIRNPALPTADLSFDELQHSMDDDDKSVEGDQETLADYALLAARGSDLLLLDDTLETAEGADIIATIETGDTSLGSVQVNKLVNKLALDVTDQTGTPLRVYVCARRSLADEIVWQGPFTMDVEQRYAYFMITGIWFRFRFVKVDGSCVFRGYGISSRLRGDY